ncbi:cation transporter [Clostridium ljungdahlii]|uniref:HMA domain-containing protein n=1 Tax=Clostridium ljungdahlii TaxID=1538 RepID=A0A166R355_9CLOT|nr:cation transporter [Clostridium ljungdahlii]OAA90591.1 hypothetical protein WY13_01495 [Clostridium ljungdahlii]
MLNKIKKELFLQGLYGETSAKIIEERVNALNGVSDAIMDFENQTLTIQITNVNDIDSIIIKAKYIIQDKEPQVVVRIK